MHRSDRVIRREVNNGCPVRGSKGSKGSKDSKGSEGSKGWIIKDYNDNG
jgi:hypothetical protein